MKFKLFKSKKFIIMAAIASLATLAMSVLGASTPVPPGGSRIDSTTGVLNRSRNETTYKSSTAARVDETINIQVWYHNTEEDDSGKNANNINVRVGIPSTKSTNHIITSSVGGSNTNIVTNNAYVTTQIPTNLQFISGSAQRRYNTGTNASPHWVVQNIPDSITTSGYNIQTMRPCWNFQESIILQARVMAPSISIVKQVKIEGSSATWADSISATPGDTLAYLITVRNTGNTTLNNLIVRDSLPPRLQFVSGSAVLYNGNHPYPNGVRISDSLISGGVNTGNYTPGADVKVRFLARIPSDASACSLDFRNIAAARADNLGEYWNEANVRSACRPLSGAITITKFNDLDGDGTRDSGEIFLPNWTFDVTNNAGYSTAVTTNSFGSITINNLAFATYQITERQQGGWHNTTPASRSVVLNSGSASVEFGNQRNEIIRGAITVYKFEDLNQNRVQDSNESLLSGWHFRITGNGIDQTIITGTGGSATIGNLPNGVYTVEEVLQTGWICTTGATRQTEIIRESDETIIFGNLRTTTPPPGGGGTPPTSGGPLATSGPAETAAATGAAMTLSGGILAWIRSKKDLISALRK